jgi:RimJ/RimL family protein N-acetyltransferase
MLPTLKTERLVLRVPKQEDFDSGWSNFHSDAACMEHLGGAMPPSLGWRALAQVVGMWSLRGFGQFSVIERLTGAWVGRVGPWEPEGWPAPEVGWMIARSSWGKGYATEAADACLRYVFGELRWSRVTHMIHPKNTPSQAVARRLGSSLIEAVTLPPPFDVEQTQMWGQTSADWRTTQLS